MNTANTILKGLGDDAEDEWKFRGVTSKWTALFQVANLPDTQSIVSLSTPASTGSVERIFFQSGQEMEWQQEQLLAGAQEE